MLMADPSVITLFEYVSIINMLSLLTAIAYNFQPEGSLNMKNLEEAMYD